MYIHSRRLICTTQRGSHAYLKEDILINTSTTTRTECKIRLTKRSSQVPAHCLWILRINSPNLKSSQENDPHLAVDKARYPQNNVAGDEYAAPAVS